jgi:hypothetical protein
MQSRPSQNRPSQNRPSQNRPSQISHSLGQLFVTISVFGALWVSTAESMAQVIQFPIVRQFGVSTTVMVPDSGRASLGGVRSAREGQVSRGNPLLPGRLGSNRAIGREHSTSDAWAVVRIIDMKEWDRMTLLAASPDEISRLSEKAADITKAVRQNQKSNAGASSLAELRSRRQAIEQNALAETRKKLEKAEDFEKRGRLATARIYYRLAYQDGDSATRTRALTALRRLSIGDSKRSPAKVSSAPAKNR